jgi:hypothetical protein
MLAKLRKWIPATEDVCRWAWWNEHDRLLWFFLFALGLFLYYC